MLVFLRQYEDELILVVINLSRFSQVAELDLSKYKGSFLEEAFSQNKFPEIGERPYVITLGPHAHYWFLVRGQKKDAERDEKAEKELFVEQSWTELLEADGLKRLEEEILPSYLYRCRWFSSKSQKIRSIKVQEDV